MNMQGKIAIVTAAASGTGRAGALILAREGVAVCVADQDQAGVEAVVILDGRRPHAMLVELFTEHGAGTLVSA